MYLRCKIICFKLQSTFDCYWFVFKFFAYSTEFTFSTHRPLWMNFSPTFASRPTSIDFLCNFDQVQPLRFPSLPENESSNSSACSQMKSFRSRQRHPFLWFLGYSVSYLELCCFCSRLQMLLGNLVLSANHHFHVH